MTERHDSQSEGYITYGPAVPGGPVRRLAYGLTSAAKVETTEGWRRVEALLPGHEVQTLAGGTARIQRIERRKYWSEVTRAWPEGLILVPDGALGTCEGLYLLPDQLLAMPGAGEADGHVLIRAATLEGRAGVARALPVDGIDIFALRFEEDEVVWTNSGLLIHCPPSWPPVARTAPHDSPVAGLTVLTDAEAARLLDRRYPRQAEAAEDRRRGSHPAA